MSKQTGFRAAASRMLTACIRPLSLKRERIPLIPQLKAYWRLRRQNCTTLALFVSIQISLGVWQCHEYATNASDQAAFGWGVALAKGCAGALYPTLFGLIISMSRWTATFVRSNAVLADFINWDEFRTFHMTVAVTAYILTSLHALGHLAGTFVHAADGSHQKAVTMLLGPKYGSVDYGTFIKSTPGWTGILAFAMFTWMCIASSPFIRRFEIFQASHFLAFPMIGMLMIHGSSHLLQYPALGFVLLAPTLLICLERLTRTVKAWIPHTAQVQQSDQSVVRITLPAKSLKNPKPGQYCLIRSASLSGFEWHPFSISGRTENGDILFFAKQSGDWTEALTARVNNEAQLSVNVDGPFGAPAQQFHQYDHVMLFATGIGITPCASIINSFMQKEHPWNPTDHLPRTHDLSDPEQGMIPRRYTRLPQYVHVYWSTRSSCIGMISWFVDMVNQVQEVAYDHLRLRITINITDVKSEAQCPELESVISDADMSVQKAILSWQFGRLDLTRSMTDHYQTMTSEVEDIFKQASAMKVGVFFCGAKTVKRQLARLCMHNTVLGILSNHDIEYHFRPEVF